jgi:PBSX family phage terminase large subunit
MPTAARSRSRPVERPAGYRGAAAELIEHTGDEVVICGPAGTGKSLAALHKLHACAKKHKGMRGLIVRQTRESLTQSALVTFEEKVLDDYYRRRVAANCQRRVRQSYVDPNGSEIVVGGLDKPSKVMSTEFDLIYVQEAIEASENAWESLTTRCRNGVMPYQQVMGDTNPDAPHHWLRRRADQGKVTLLESRHQDNPAYFARDGTPTAKGALYLAKLEALSGVRRLRLLKGLWAGAEGLIYDEWDRAVHWIDAFPIPADWRRIRSIDFGFTNPFVCQWWAIDPDGRMHLYREWYLSQRIVADHARKIARLSEGESYEATVSDHDAEDRATLLSCGIPTVPAAKAVKPGIEAVQLRLRKQGDGRPRLFVHKGCTVQKDPVMLDAGKPTGLVEELDAYIWAKSPDGRPVKEEPAKLNDHGADAMRYAVSHIDGLGCYSAGAF